MISNALVDIEKPDHQIFQTNLHLTLKGDTDVEEVHEDNILLIDQIYTFTPIKMCSDYLISSKSMSMLIFFSHVSYKIHCMNNFNISLTFDRCCWYRAKYI